MLDIQLGPILWTILNFTILLIVLRLIAWKPIMKSLKAREDSINDALDRAETAKKDAERILAENQKALGKAEEEAQHVLRESREYASKVRDEAMQKAENESRKLLAQAQAEIERSKQQALNELRQEVATLAVGATEKILREKIDAQRHQQLIDEYINQATSIQN